MEHIVKDLKIKPLKWYETSTGFTFQDYIGCYEVYLNTKGTWTFDSGESVSEHKTKESAMGQGPVEHLRRVSSVLDMRE